MGALSPTTVAAASTSAAGAIVVLLLVFAVVLFEVAAIWALFHKAGRPGWAAVVPIYGAYVLVKVAGRPGWWLLLYLVPFVNVVISIIVLYELSKSFGHGGGFTVGLVVLPMLFFPILGFGSDAYLGPGGATYR